jgi:polyhydroxyalkanoate synthesis regulator phasin
MLEWMKKTVFTGIGLALRSRDEAENMARELVNMGKMSEQEGKQFIEEMMNRYDKSRNELENRMNEMISRYFKKKDFAEKADIEILRQEIEALKEAVARLENRPPESES